MTDREIAAKYVPHFYKDKNEAFDLVGIGYTVFYETAKSPSFKRMVEVDKEKMAFAIEYALYWDFDIQHMYDLEHAFVFVGKDGEVIDVEASFHGHCFKSMINGDLKFEGTHAVLYLQPGKHAVMPDPKYFRLHRELYIDCNKLAGYDGLLITPVFAGRLHKTPEIDEKVRQYIKDNFQFMPTMEFIPVPPVDDIIMPYADLDGLILEHLTSLVKQICG